VLIDDDIPGFGEEDNAKKFRYLSS